jgi:ABC-2 type transport system permease protein
MKAFRRLLIADFKQFYRDRTALFFTFAFPVLFMVIFGLVFSGDTDVNYDIGLVNRGSSPVGEGIAQALRQVPIFEIAESEDLDDKLGELEDGDVRAVIVIPANIESSIAAGDPVDITVYYDPSQTTSTQIIRSVMREAIDEIDRQITEQPALLRLSEEAVRSQDLRNIDYLVPGIVAMSAMFLGLFGSLTLVERREKKVLRRFGATPARRSTVVYSQVVYRLVLAILQTVIIIAIAYFAFDVQMLGNWLALTGFVLLGTLVFVSLGYLAVSRARTVEGAMPIVQILQFPMLFLSGVFFPVEFFPSFMRPIVDAIPVTYLGDGLRQIMVDATPLHSLTVDAAVLGGWLVVCLVLAIRLFKWE